MTNTNTTTSISPAAKFSYVRVDGIQSVPPLRPTNPRHTRKVTLKHPLTMGVVQNCHHILFYYKASEEVSRWVVGGRLKECIGKALLEYPMIAGRLRWADQDQDVSARLESSAKRGLELVSNDSGVRLVEAKVAMSMDEFLWSNEEDDAAGDLPCWDQVSEEDPQFRPLAYVQVTNFECGGYSVGLTLSLVLGDLMELTNFIKHAAKLLKEIFHLEGQQVPVFYLPKLKANNVLSKVSGAKTRKLGGQTVLYTVNVRKDRNLEKEDGLMVKHIVLICIQEAEEKLCVKIDLDFMLFVEDWRTSEVSVEIVSKGGLVSPTVESDFELRCTKWSETYLDEITFWGTQKPAMVSYRIGLKEDVGLVMVSSSKAEGMVNVTVTIPKI